MNSLVFAIVLSCFIVASNCSCYSSSTNGTYSISSQKRQQQNQAQEKQLQLAVDTGYCINIQIVIQNTASSGNLFSYTDTEGAVKLFIQNGLNSTTSEKIKIDCANNKNVSTGDKSIAYAYICCDNSAKQGITCDNPKLPDFNGANQNIASFIGIFITAIAYYLVA